MDERLEKAYGVANYMATLSNQRRVIKQELEQKLVHYINGGTFKVDQTLIAFTKAIVDSGHTADVVFMDANDNPVMVADVETFLSDIISKHFEAVNEYFAKTSEIKSKRKLTDIVSL